MERPPEGIWKYPPIRAFLWTTIVLGGALYGLDWSPIAALGFAVVAALLNAIYVEVVVTDERKKIAALQLRLDMATRYGIDFIK